MELNYLAIGQRIQTARMKKNLTQETLSNLTDLSPSHICHIENAKTKVSLAALVSIANVLHVTVDDLLYDCVDAVRESYDKDFKDLVSDCSAKNRRIILETATQLKKSLEE